MVAVLGPGSVVGTEQLIQGGVSEYNVRTGADSLLWGLSRDDYYSYLKVFLALWIHRSWILHRQKERSNMIR